MPLNEQSSTSLLNHSQYMNNPEVEELIISLNELLERLSFPLALETPFDLTPSLLLAILECMLKIRLPISQTLRETRDLPSKVQAMKLFLRILEDDVIQANIGLCGVDPRSLAVGEWDEVVFIGKLLCWLGKKLGLIPGLSEASLGGPPTMDKPKPTSESERTLDARARALSPSNHSSVTTRNSLNSALSMIPSIPAAASDTSVMSASDEPSSPALSDLELFREPTFSVRPELTFTSPPQRTPRCIHEVEEGSFVCTGTPGAGDISHATTSNVSFCHCSQFNTLHKHKTPARYTGRLDRVDNEDIRTFEASQSIRTSPTLPRTPNRSALGHSSGTPSGTPTRVVTRHNSPSQYTLALMNERAKLMSELARMKAR